MEAPATFHRAIDRDATAPEILLDSKRIEETLRPTGLLFLVKKLFERSQVGHFQFARVGIGSKGIASLSITKPAATKPNASYAHPLSGSRYMLHRAVAAL